MNTGGDPKTDLSLHSNAGANVDSPQPGGLATQTANLVSPACTVLGLSTAVTHDSELRDEFPSISQGPDPRDDAFPRSGDIIMNSSSENTDAVFTQDFHADEKFKSCPPVAAHPS